MYVVHASNFMIYNCIFCLAKFVEKLQILGRWIYSTELQKMLQFDVIFAYFFHVSMNQLRNLGQILIGSRHGSVGACRIHKLEVASSNHGRGTIFQKKNCWNLRGWGVEYRIQSRERASVRRVSWSGNVFYIM